MSGIESFPFPFEADEYRYTANLEPSRTRRDTAAGAWGTRVLDLDEHYREELDLRASILQADPGRCRVAAHLRPAAWDALFTILELLAEEYPGEMSLTPIPAAESMPGAGGAGSWHWINTRRGVEVTFTLGDEASLGTDPLRFAGDQVQDDLVLLDQRDGGLWVDAGLVTFASNWSIGFDAGMSFREIHGPIPRDLGEGVIERAEGFLMRLTPGPGFRRLNWSSTAGHRLDTSLETYDQWAPERLAILDGDLPRELHLRVEVQHLIRLPVSNAILFLIRTYLRPFAEVAQVPEWRRRMTAVFESLPEDIAQYKGFTRYREPLLKYLRAEA